MPLREHFGISYFTYHRIDEEGRYTVLVDRPDWAELYVDKKIYLHDPFLRHPSVYQSGLTFMQNHGSSNYKETFAKTGKQVLDMDIGVVLIQKSETCVEFFGFTGSKSSSLENLYVNHPALLKSFASHFKSELGSVLNRMQEEGLSLTNLKGEDFYCKNPIHPKLSRETFLEYYKDLGMGELIEQASQLSSRERQCLTHLIQDRSAKETAAILGLKFRTIEAYFENIKNKLSCQDKREVLRIAKTLGELGLLDIS